MKFSLKDLPFLHKEYDQLEQDSEELFDHIADCKACYELYCKICEHFTPTIEGNEKKPDGCL